MLGSTSQICMSSSSSSTPKHDVFLSFRGEDTRNNFISHLYAELDVRHQRQSYAEAFVKHQRRFKDDQLDAWKKSLTQVAGLSGWDSQVTRPEQKLIEDIAKDILRKLQLNCSIVSDYKGMIGIDKHIEQIQSLLHIESEVVQIVEGRIVMHDLIQEMGHEIVRKQCVNDPGKRSRLWKPEEIYQVLKKNKGTDAIQCIFLDICKIEKTDKELPNLKTLDLRGSQNLIQIPDLAQCPNIEEVILSHCQKLGHVYSSSFLCKLKCLWLNGCINLRSLHIPSNILQITSGLIVLHGCHNLEMFSVNLSNCESLSSLPIDLFKLKFLKRLYLGSCLNLEMFPEIEETMESMTVLVLDKTAIKKLPSSLHRLVSLEELSLYNCQKLETIPSSIGSLSKLNKLSIMDCESLETFPSSIFKLKLTKLDLHGCSMLKIFPEILEQAETFVHINLTKTAIKELPTSLEYLVGLQTLCLKLCTELVTLPNSIVNLNHLSELDCSGCCSIVNLPESIAHLSSLKSLVLSDCKRLECIPQLPPSMNYLFAYDCPSVGRVMPNSRLELPSNSKEGVFEFHFTNSQELDGSAHNSNIAAEAWHRISEVAYRDVFFCFPGSSVPHWFPYRCQGCSVSMNNDSKKWCCDDSLIGFA
ncbi:hypothetical protein P8452_35019 [Trifolium repens]|nr:hypothetical protein P8452_35019 [Trifolium repens]